MILNFYRGARGEKRDGKDAVARENLSRVHQLLRRRAIVPPRGYTESVSLLATTIANEVRTCKNS